MTEEERQAVEEECIDRGFSPLFARKFIADIEAKLYPKHPSKGAICEVWEARVRCTWMAYSNGARLVDLDPGRPGDPDDSWEFAEVHYRVIPTAKDALKAVQAIVSKPPSSTTTFLTQEQSALANVALVIQRLIDNALEG